MFPAEHFSRLIGFTGDQYDWETGQDHTLFRQYNPTQGRWISPDPAGIAAADPATPQSLNRYAYVMNDPLNDVDPAGLCDIVSGGVTQAPDTPETAAQQAYARETSSLVVFPFSGQNTPESIFGMGSSPTIAPLVNAILDAAQQTAPGENINIVTWSGSADVLSDAINSLPSNVVNRIGNITYLSPGMAPGDSEFQSQNGTTANVFGTGFLNNLVTAAADVPFITINCGQHKASCFFGQEVSYLLKHSGSPCKTRKFYTRQNPAGYIPMEFLFDDEYSGHYGMPIVYDEPPRGWSTWRFVY